MNRRTFTIASLAILGGCAPGTNTIDPTQAITDAQIVVTGITGVWRSFIVLYPRAVTPAQQASATAALAAAQTAVAQLQASASQLTTAATLKAVEDNINVVMGVLTAVLPTIPNVPPEITAGVLAATVLLPIIEAMVNQLQGQSVKAAAVRAAPGMTTDEARRTLRAVR
jgi:hypothetical protein